MGGRLTALQDTTNDLEGDGRGLSRRGFLKVAGVAAAATFAGRLAHFGGDAADAAPASRWSDPTTWGGAIPGPSSIVTITGAVMLDTNVSVAGVVVKPGGQLVFDPTKSCQLTSTGNIVSSGLIQIRPASAAVVHRIVFTGFNAAAMVGGGMVPLATDVGLWVMDPGVLDIAGDPKTAWTRVAGAVAAGASTITLATTPVGWRVGDEIVITPTGSPATSKFHDAFDATTIAAISGNTVTLSNACAFAHPTVSVGDGRVFSAEVLNLTRNVQIEGTPSARTHVWVNSTRPQYTAFAALRHMSPVGKLGRYGYHFHMCGAGSAGSLLDGVVVRDADGHAFVPHQSNGITLRSCIAYSTKEDAFWYDPAPDNRSVPNAPPSNGLRYDSCVAARTASVDPIRGYTLTGFFFGAGTGSVAFNCVATGVKGSVNASGFAWPEMSQGVWTFDQCLSHNNATNALWTWQNNGNSHVITNFVGYHCGKYGISHGAYVNNYVYRNSVLYGNKAGGVGLHALNAQNMRFADLLIDGAGLSPYAFESTRHTLAGGTTPVLVERCVLRGFTTAAVGFTYPPTQQATKRENIDFVDCTFGGNAFWLVTGLDPASQIRVQDQVNGAIQLRPAGQSGTLRPAWNATVSAIAPFAASSTPPPSTTTTTSAPPPTTAPPTTASPTTAPTTAPTAPTTATTGSTSGPTTAPTTVPTSPSTTATTTATTGASTTSSSSAQTTTTKAGVTTTTRRK